MSSEKWIKHYSSSQRILLVGEGDFSFSVCLAKAFGSGENMVATSLDHLDFLTTNYAKARLHIGVLQIYGCTVRHGVDATAMAGDYFLMFKQFDRIVFNFPHAGFEKRSSKIEHHQKLIKGFFENAKTLLAAGGEIHVTHKSNGFFLAWDIVYLAWLCGLRLIEEVDFQLSDYPGYSNKYGSGGLKGDLAFNCNPSKTYKFGFDVLF